MSEKPTGRHAEKASSSIPTQHPPAASRRQPFGLYGVIGAMAIVIVAGGAYLLGQRTVPAQIASSQSAQVVGQPAATTPPAAPVPNTDASRQPLMSWKPLFSGKDPNGFVSQEESPLFMKLSHRIGTGGRILLVAFDLSTPNDIAPAFSCTEWTYQGQNEGSYIFKSRDYITETSSDSFKGKMMTRAYKGPVGSDDWGDSANSMCVIGEPDDSSQIEESQVYVPKRSRTFWVPAALANRLHSIELSDERESDAITTVVHY